MPEGQELIAGAAAVASQFYIPATASLQERRPRTLKHDDTFALFDHYGDLPGIGSSPEGLYHRDTRYLSQFELRINDKRPLLLSSTVQDDNLALLVDLTNADFYEEGKLLLPRDTLHLHRAKFIWRGACHERLAVLNYDDLPQQVTLTLLFDGDFADLFEVRGQERPRRGEKTIELVGEGVAEIRYLGLDGVRRVCRISFDPPPQRLAPGRADFPLRLEPRRHASLFCRIECLSGETAAEGWAGRKFLSIMRQAHRERRRAAAQAAAIEGSDDLFNEVVRRSVADLYTLISNTPHGPYPYAGVPWFSVPFGRDALITALTTLWLDPGIARGVLHFLAATQADAVDPFRDAEPGKILHEMRSGEMAELGEVPFGRYYGSIDSTPLFLWLAGEYFQRTGDVGTVRALWPNLDRALAWMDAHGDIDGDGFLEYARKEESGLLNQGWKDSHDSISHADGRLAEPPIALAEVQGYVYAARRAAAAIARAVGHPAIANEQEARAEALRARFEESFWCEGIGAYALALDADKRPCEVLSSNAGQVLSTGIAAPARATAVADALMGPRGFSGWGIRTLALGERRFNPMSYHNGSIWPHDNALVALGFARYGLKEQALRLLQGMFEAAAYMDLRRLPELFCGFARRPRKAPTSYPVACAPQAWASATPFALLQAVLGLSFDVAAREIRFDRPLLPAFLSELHLRRLRLDHGSVDVVLHRHGHEVAVSVLRRSGDLRVVVVH